MADLNILREQCDRCGHTLSFHGKAAKTKCKAVGCRKGPRGKGSCVDFKPRKGAPQELRDALKASLSPAL